MGMALLKMLDRFFICTSYLFGILANKEVMLYCCHVFRSTGVTTTECLRLNFFFQNGYNIPVRWRAYVNVEGSCTSCDISIMVCVSQCYMRMIRTSSPFCLFFWLVVCVSASGFKNWWLKSVWILLFPALCTHLLLRGMEMGRGGVWKMVFLFINFCL